MSAVSDPWVLFETAPLWMRILGLLAATVLVAKVIDIIVVRSLREFVRGTETDIDELLVDELHLPVVVTVVLVGILLAEGLLPTDVQETVAPYVGLPTLSVLVAMWAWTLNRIGNQLLDRARDTDSTYASFAPVFSNLLTFALAVGALFTILNLWGVDVTPLLASAGIAGVAIGFAARDTVANFFGGLALYFDRTYRVGDYIELDSGEKGRVAKVGIRSTTVMTRDEVMVTVPNAVLNNARIINQSAPKRRKRIHVPIGVAYGTDIDVLEEEMVAVAEEEGLVLDSPRPQARFLAFGDSALEYELRCWVATPVRETKARHRLNRALYQRLQEVGIEIPFPQREIRVIGGSGADDHAAELAEADD